MGREVIFNSVLKQLMAQNNLTMKELGEIVGKSESSVSYWISGKITPRIGVIQKLADYFNISTDEMLYGTKEYSDKIVDGVNMSKAQFALYGETKDLSDEELEEVASFINYVKQKREK